MGVRPETFVFFPVHPRKVLITKGVFCKVLRINDLGEMLCFRPSGVWLPRDALHPRHGPSASSGQAVGWILPPLRGWGGLLSVVKEQMQICLLLLFYRGVSRKIPVVAVPAHKTWAQPHKWLT